jgi:hypothetical protein
MDVELTAGIPNPKIPGHWLVPPWPVTSGFGEVVRHFMRFHLWGHRDTSDWLAFYEGYAAGLDAAPTDDLTHELALKWADDMRDCVARCVTAFRKKLPRTLEHDAGETPEDVLGVSLTNCPVKVPAPDEVRETVSN